MHTVTLTTVKVIQPEALRIDKKVLCSIHIKPFATVVKECLTPLFSNLFQHLLHGA